MYSEDYQVINSKGLCVYSYFISSQVELLAATFPVFDEYKKKFLVGEMVWNFADFQTGQSKYKSCMYCYKQKTSFVV